MRIYMCVYMGRPQFSFLVLLNVHFGNIPLDFTFDSKAKSKHFLSSMGQLVKRNKRNGENLFDDDFINLQLKYKLINTFRKCVHSSAVVLLLN